MYKRQASDTVRADGVKVKALSKAQIKDLSLIHILRWQTAFIIIVGIPVIYLFGAVQMKYVTNQPWGAIMIQAVLPFIPLDIVKCFVAAGIAKPLRRLFPAD